MDASDMFSMFFGGGRRQRSGPRKGEDVVHQINVTLEVQRNGLMPCLSGGLPFLVGRLVVRLECTLLLISFQDITIIFCIG